MTTYTVQELALQYAEKLTAYHAAEQRSKEDARAAYNEMCYAQNALNEACERAAELAK
jgi:hypothetical protein